MRKHSRQKKNIQNSRRRWWLLLRWQHTHICSWEQKCVVLYSYTSDENVIDNAKKSINGIQSLLFFATYWILQLVLWSVQRGIRIYLYIQFIYIFCHFIRIGILKCNRTLSLSLILFLAHLCSCSVPLRACHSPYVYSVHNSFYCCCCCW